MATDMPAPTQDASSSGPKKINRLVLCFDGTGNNFTATEVDTNIVKIYEMLDRETDDQYHYYQPGIGTFTSGAITNTTNNGWYANTKQWIDETRDEMFAGSFVDHVIGGYRFLLRYYTPGDKVYIFGFSRGAYTARFLAEMIDNIGLLSKGNEEMIRFAWQAFSDYQQLGGKFNGTKVSTASKEDDDVDAYDAAADCAFPEDRHLYKSSTHVANGTSDKAVKPWTGDPSQNPAALYKKHGAGVDKNMSPKQRAKLYMDIFRSTFCRKGVKVYFLGLFDCVNSVAAFDVHKNSTPYMPKAPARHVRHAVSVHERRANFKPSLFLLNKEQTEDPDYAKKLGIESLKEIWFAGNHGDVGGGWPLETVDSQESDYLLSDVALKWMVAEVRLVDERKNVWSRTTLPRKG
jgi:uncharacterized protein (DUF2235 family)